MATRKQIRELKDMWKDDTNKVTEEDLETYIKYKIETYESITDTPLWECFQDDFGFLTKDAFKLLDMATL
jgi:hypothetical protein